VVVLALSVVQVVVVARHQLLVVHVAREAARAAAVSDDDVGAAADRAARHASGLDGARLEVLTTVAGDEVQVSVTYHDPTDVAMAGALLPDLSLTAEAIMRREG
jgi:hypothetical protein